ncbi:MAG TPA: sulfatase-like hydrolase/transferase [Thermoanaerobaculia bacterium]|nr:sulfatase-like hydrolase/transferase [Thermoanaerobaculia bacterium]
MSRRTTSDRGAAAAPRPSRRVGRPVLAVWLVLTLAAALLAVGCRGQVNANAAGVAAPANLLLVTLDTVRADHVGAYGDRTAETPALDRLAAEGMRFAAASSPVPLTLPAHSSLLSGLLPPHHGLRNNGAGSFPSDRPTLATRLAAAGYRTGAFVGAFVLDHRFGLSRGFGTYDDEMERDATGGLALDAERRGDRVVDRALAWLTSVGTAPAAQGARPAPFFLWVHLYDAHAPYNPPPPYRDRHRDQPYDGEIAFADVQLGRLLEELDRRHLAGTTIVAVAADHGEALGEHGELTHGLLLYEPTLRVPLLLRGPGLKAGQVISTPVSLVDLGPTLAGLLGQPLDAHGLDGRDLSSPLRHGGEPPAADLYAETRYPALFGWSPLAALRRRGLKYIDAPTPELYDLDRDPQEAQNLAGQPTRSGAAQGLAGRLAAFEAQPASSAAPAAGSGAETRARLESLGYAGGTAAGNPQAGAATSKAARGADPKARVALFRRYEEANTDLRAGRPAAALPILAEIVAADPANPVFHGKLAQLYRERGDLIRAIPHYRQAAESAPKDAEAWYNLGITLEEAGQTAESQKALTAALTLDPSRPEVHNALGIVLLAQNNPAEAEREFRQVLALDPGDARAFNNLGNILRGTGRLAEAEEAYRKAVAIAPRYAEAWNGLGTLAVERNQPRQALTSFERALALAPAYHEVRLNRAIAYEMAGDRNAAMAAYREFLAAAGSSPQYASQRRAAAQLLARLSDREAGPQSTERR